MHSHLITLSTESEHVIYLLSMNGLKNTGFFGVMTPTVSQIHNLHVMVYIIIAEL